MRFFVDGPGRAKTAHISTGFESGSGLRQARRGLSGGGPTDFWRWIPARVVARPGGRRPAPGGVLPGAPSAARRLWTARQGFPADRSGLARRDVARRDAARRDAARRSGWLARTGWARCHRARRGASGAARLDDRRCGESRCCDRRCCDRRYGDRRYSDRMRDGCFGPRDGIRRGRVGPARGSSPAVAVATAAAKRRLSFSRLLRTSAAIGAAIRFGMGPPARCASMARISVSMISVKVSTTDFVMPDIYYKFDAMSR